jgi:hypothetical protein
MNPEATPPTNDPRWGARFSRLDAIVLVAAGIAVASRVNSPPCREQSRSWSATSFSSATWSACAARSS